MILQRPQHREHGPAPWGGVEKFLLPQAFQEETHRLKNVVPESLEIHQQVLNHLSMNCSFSAVHQGRKSEPLTA